LESININDFDEASQNDENADINENYE